MLNPFDVVGMTVVTGLVDAVTDVQKVYPQASLGHPKKQGRDRKKHA
jgi:hypothetical protein